METQAKLDLGGGSEQTVEIVSIRGRGEGHRPSENHFSSEKKA